MNRIVTKLKVSSDGVLHLSLPVGMSEADKEVQVTVESTPPQPLERARTMLACDLLHSDLLGMWSERGDIDDNRKFARRLREQAQNRRQD